MSPQKKRDWETPTGAAVAGAGGVTTVGGLFAGGVPKAKVDSIKLRHLTENEDVKQGKKSTRAKEFARNVPKARKGMQGGVGGFRESAHYITESDTARRAYEGGQKPLKQMSKPEAYKHGMLTGHSPPERVIMGHMAGVRRGGNKALGAGLALTAGGAALSHRGKKKQELSKRDNRRTAETASGAALGAGATTAGAAYGGSKVFASQGKKWEGQAKANIAEAGRLVPTLGTESKKGANPRLKHRVMPVVRDSEVDTNKKALFGHSKETIARAGHLRGQAKQQAYFGDVYGQHARMFRRGVKPALAVAGAGAAGLGASKAHEKLKKAEHGAVGKNLLMSDISKTRAMGDTEIRHRKKVQAGLSQAGGVLGLTALGGTLAASRGGRTALRKVPQLKPHIKAPAPKDPNRDRIKGAITPVLATSAGLGGIGSFNFASYTRAESKKRQQPGVVKKREDGPMEMGYFGEEGHPIELPEIEVPISKAWEPSAGNFDSERSRKKRNKGYQGAALVGAGAGGAYAGSEGMKAVHAVGQAKPKEMAPITRGVDPKNANKPWVSAKFSEAERAIPTKSFKAVRRHGGRTALGVGAVAAAGAAHKKLKQKEKGSWQPYAKRMTMNEIQKSLES